MQASVWGGGCGIVHPVTRILPLGYGGILLAELVWLSVRFATAPPESTDPLNVWLGWIGLGSMVLMLVYSLARRSRTMRRWLRLSAWLHLHIFLGLQGVLCVLFHSASLVLDPRPVYLLNPAILNLIGVVVVFCSGIFGRYMYGWLPRQLSGERMDTQEVEAALAELGELPDGLAEMWAPQEVRSFPQLLRAGWQLRRHRRALLARADLSEQQRPLLLRRLLLSQTQHRLRYTQRIFRHWINLHRPLAAAIYVLSVVHVWVAIMYGGIH